MGPEARVVYIRNLVNVRIFALHQDKEFLSGHVLDGDHGLPLCLLAVNSRDLFLRTGNKFLILLLLLYSLLVDLYEQILAK